MRKYQQLYVVTTNDELELPKFVGTMAECSAYLGRKSSDLRIQMSLHESSRHTEWKDNFKIYRIGLEEATEYGYGVKIRKS